MGSRLVPRRPRRAAPGVWLAHVALALIVAVVAALGAAAPTRAQLDWQQHSGSSINLLLISHPFVDALKPLLPEFTELTGIEVTYEELAEQPGFEKLLADLSSGTGTYDLFMTSPLQNWQYATANWVEPLDAYLDNPALTDLEAYDLEDFAPGILASGRWTREPMQGVGEGPLWALPINFETYQLAYRPSIMEQLGLEVPETYAELLEMAPNLATEGPNGPIYGLITRFDKYWDLPYLTFGTMLQSYGVEMIDAEGNLQICSPQSIAATEDFVTLIRTASPEGAGAFTWDQAMQGFASGQYVMSFNEANLFAPVYEDPEQSAIADDVGYAPTPLGPDGERLAGAWVWSMSMNANSQDKEAAWLFLQWLTSKETMIKTHLGGNMNPVRQSAWEDPEVAALVEEWGETPGQYREVAEQMAEVAGVRFPPHPELTRMLDRWAEAIQQSYFDNGNVEANLCAAQADIERMIGG
ncbi:MAG: ABC-type sugar transport system, periplasmic component [Thermomicrobiales bacterium]|jgi:multiple sugar transport system substrate-binding protein|nr:ABC-type sugar transport system, periplasmic component [Thermomicrobiales bacterium]